MNIGFFTDGFTPQLNGIATNIEALVDVLEARGHSVSIFAPKMGGYLDQRARVFRVPSVRALQDPPLWIAAPAMMGMEKKISGLDLDIVHIHSPFSMQFLGLQVAHRAHLPVVSTYHTLLPAQVHHVQMFGRQPMPVRWAEWYSAWSSNQCDHIIAPSEKIKACLEEYGVRRPISIIRNGVALERFQSGEYGFLRARYGLQATDKIMLSVGRLTQDKNFSFLVRVLARLVAHDPKIYLALVGQGPLKAEFERMAEQLGVRKNLLLTGPIDPLLIANAYADADIFVNASSSETFSMVTLEAAASGVPAVVTNDEALAAIVTQGQNGLVVPPDEDGFASGVRQILADAGLERRMRLAAYESARRFSVEHQAGELLDLYRNLSVEKRREPRAWRAEPKSFAHLFLNR